MTDDEIMQVATSGNMGTIEFARAIVAAHTAKLLEGVEMPMPELLNGFIVNDDKCKLQDGYTADQLQAYGDARAAAMEVKARVKALDEAQKIIESEYDNWDNERPLRICYFAIEKLKEKRNAE